MKNEEIRKVVRESYGKIAARQTGGCCPGSGCGCGSSQETTSRAIGYSDEEMAGVPEGANLGLGCGNPTALASLKENEIVLDLGSGAGFDCFLVAGKVGPGGKAIGIDMTPEMLEQARDNARKGGYNNVEFRLGEIENLPVADNSVDVVISNCVINLSPYKQRVFDEVYRVLKPGGRVMISDIVLKKDLTEEFKESVEAYVACVSGAVKKEEYLKFMHLAGLKEINVISEVSAAAIFDADALEAVAGDSESAKKAACDAANSIVSMHVSAIKPESSCCCA